MKLEFSRHIFSKKKYTNVTFHVNQSSRSRIVPCEWTDGRTNLTKIIFAFRNVANAT